MSDFSSMGLNEPIISAIKKLGFNEPTEVQKKSIPLLIDKPKDIVSLAQTGTGKTAAFGLPILHHIDMESKKTQALIIAPTRELCLQITSELKKYAVNFKRLNIVSVYGGSSIQEQAKSIKKGAQIIRNQKCGRLRLKCTECSIFDVPEKLCCNYIRIVR